MRQQTIQGILITKPTREDVLNLRVGDRAPNCFGGMGIVKEILFAGFDIHQKAYVGYTVTWGKSDDNGSTITATLKEDEIVSTVAISQTFMRTVNVPWNEGTL